MTRIALDAMGGDYAPKQIVVGAVDAACGLPEVKIFLVGKQEAIQREVARFSKGRKARYQHAVSIGALEVVHAPDEVEMSDVPVEAVRKKKDCSINVAMRMVKEGRADVFVSAGNSGAVATSAILNLGRIPGVKRPAIAMVLPTKTPGQGQDAQEALSDREKEVIVSLVQGMSNKEIADHLFISTNTVITHRRNIARKLQIHSPAGLTIYAIVNNLVDISSVKL